MDVREKLVELLDTNCGYVDEVKAEVLADHLIAHGVTVQKWISAKDKLPQGADGKSLCKNIIAYTIDGQVVPGWLNGAYWYLLLQDDIAFTRLERDCVTHWMPLPQPPKGE